MRVMYGCATRVRVEGLEEGVRSTESHAIDAKRVRVGKRISKSKTKAKQSEETRF